MDKNIKDLIFGKNDMLRIVSVEPDNIGKCEIFTEDKKGKVESIIVDFKYYILFKKQMSERHRKMQGNQTFQWLREFTTKYKYMDVLKNCAARRVEIFAVRDPKESFLVRNGYTYYKGMEPTDVSILSIDIEDTYGIRELPKENGKLLLIANTYRKNGVYIRKQFAYDEYGAESLMLDAWAKWVRKQDPSIIIGHNLFGHDLKVLDFAAKKWRMKLRLGRNKSEIFVNKRDSQFRKDGSQSYSYKNMTIYGREIVDTWFLAMKYDAASGRGYENYKLKYIINHEGLEKVDRVHYDAANIEKDYKDPIKWKMIKQYNIDDSDDPIAYFDLVSPVFFHYNKSVPRSFQSVVNSATGSQINSLMVRSYLQHNHSIAYASEQVKYPGAISFGMPGIHRNVFKIDVQSLYPSIILSNELYDKKKDPKQHMLKMLKYFTNQRLKNKKLHKETGKLKYKILSDSQKIVCNSAYGFYGAPKLNYNSPRIAARVTEQGREILMTAIEWSTGIRSVPEGVVGNKVDVSKGDEL